MCLKSKVIVILNFTSCGTRKILRSIYSISGFIEIRVHCMMYDMR